MRKKFLALITVLCMTLGCAVPVFGESVSTDADVQAAFDAYNAMDTALYAVPGDYDAMKAEFKKLEDASVIIDNDDAKSDEWQSIVADKIGVDEFMDTVFTVAFVMVVFEDEIEGSPGLLKNYIDYPALDTAYELVEIYTMMEEDGVDMDGMTKGIDADNGNTALQTAYAAADQKVAETNKDVFAVYEAYMMMYEALDGEWEEDYPEAIAEFEKVAYLVDGDTTNGELSLNDAIDLAILMGETNAEDALKVVNDTYAKIKAANENPSGGPGVPEGPAGGGDEGSVNDGAEGSKEKAPEGSPDTGDDMNVMPFIVVMALAAAGAVAAVRRRA